MNVSFSVANALIRLSTYSSNPKGIGRAMHFTRKCFDNIGGFEEDLYLFEDFEITERAKTHGFDTRYSDDQEVHVDGTKMVEEGVISHTYRIYKAYFHRIYKSIVSRNRYENITDDKDYFTTS